jgi:hypothetical protein
LRRGLPAAAELPFGHENPAMVRPHFHGQIFRRRIDRYHYGRRPIEFTPRTAIALAFALVLLIVIGIVGYRQSAERAVGDRSFAAPGSTQPYYCKIYSS